ncbi:Cpr-5-like, partial [Thalictrum thalictroides]
VLDRNDVGVERISTDHLSLICTSAVKESLANVFGDRFDCFVRNFGESFGCTLKTLRLVNDASLQDGEKGCVSVENIKSEASKSAYLYEHRHDQSSSISRSLVCEPASPDRHRNDPSTSMSRSSVCEPASPDRHRNDPSTSISRSSVCEPASPDGHRNDPSLSGLKSSVAIPTISGIYKSLDCFEEVQENIGLDVLNQELILHGELNQQLVCVTKRKVGSQCNGSMLNTFEKSVMEQSRSNDLKALEISLRMRQLQLDESKLAVSSDSNRLERFKIFMGISKASFKAEKYKTQLEETRHAELLKKCIDCLIAGLIIMSVSLIYGVYVYSYKLITEVTTSCTSRLKESKSWWMPKTVTSFSSIWNTLSCHVLIWSRMLFGVLLFAAVVLLLLRSSTSKQIMPVTHIVLLLGILCGMAGMLCVNSLGGSGSTWFLYWEALCSIHLVANTCTSTFFMILHGSVSVSQGHEEKTRLRSWVRRFLFYTLILVFLPLLCGLHPFASLSEWKDHFVSITSDYLYGSFSVEGS